MDGGLLWYIWQLQITVVYIIHGAHCPGIEDVVALLVAACVTHTSQFDLYMAYPSFLDKLRNFNGLIINMADKPTFFTIEMSMFSYTFRVKVHIVASILMNLAIFRKRLQVSIDRSDTNLFFLYCRHVIQIMNIE